MCITDLTTLILFISQKTQKTHGAPSDSERHVGDLGNIIANANGLANVDITDVELSLTGINSIIGRAFVVS